MADLVDQLLVRPGLYLGPQADPVATAPPSVARIDVRPLPGGSGVMFSYEVITSDNGRVHAEHAVLARTTHGLVLVTSHSHADVTTVLRESQPGYFPAEEGASPFPMAIRLEVPEPGHLVYSWSYGMPGEELRVRDVGDVRVVE
jgi:hypothetical protein